MKLFIVESPAKIKTIKKFLGADFIIKASMGHIREIPRRGLGVDIHKDFLPTFQLIESKSRNTLEVLQLMSKASEVYFAQDLDREGELIAWHLFDESGIDLSKVRRVIFNEITKTAVLKAIDSPREMDQNLIDAGMSRTILDRLIGYKLSPLIWKRFDSEVPLSIGRVQTVALCILVKREREIENFVKEEFWNIKAKFKEGFDADVVLKKDERLSKEACDKLMAKMEGGVPVVKKIVAKQEKRKPRPPFTTATLQQEASTKLKMSAKETMKVAQELYEGVNIGGESKALITYMRTDAVNLSKEATGNIRKFIESEYGQNYLPKKAVEYKGKTKNAQEAHEAIRPVYFNLPPDKVKPFLRPDQHKLYSLIWNKAVACQMSPALFDSTTVNIDINKVPFRVKGSILRFPGFLAVYDDRELEEGKEQKGSKKGNEDQKQLPPLEEGQELDLEKLVPEKKFTKPPARYTEASLVKFLEKHGIGRPSTYATIIETLLKRNYAVLNKRKFETTELGCQVSDWVEQNFKTVVDLGFTAKVEESLDEVARGQLEWIRSVRNYYDPLRDQIVSLQGFVEEDLSEEDRVCPDCGNEMIVRSGKYGQFLGCSNFPDCKTIVRKRIPLNRPSKVITTGIFCEVCNGEFHLRKSKHGKYFSCSNYPRCRNTKNQLSVAEYQVFKDHIKRKKSEETHE